MEEDVTKEEGRGRNRRGLDQPAAAAEEEAEEVVASGGGDYEAT